MVSCHTAGGDGAEAREEDNGDCATKSVRANVALVGLVGVMIMVL